MALVRFDPMNGFNSITRKMNDFISDFDKGLSVEFGGFAPRIDILEDEKTLFVQAEIPGIKKEDIKVKINEEGMLCISGEKKRTQNEEVNQDNFKQIRTERNYGTFSRSFILPDNINKESIKAKFENGVLDVSFEKSAPEAPKETYINIE